MSKPSLELSDLPQELLILLYACFSSTTDVHNLALTCRSFHQIWATHGAPLLELLLTSRLPNFDAAPLIKLQKEQNLICDSAREWLDPNPYLLGPSSHHLRLLRHNQNTVNAIAAFYMRFGHWYHKRHSHCRRHLPCASDHKLLRAKASVYTIWTILIQARGSESKETYKDILIAMQMPVTKLLHVCHIAWWLMEGHLHNYWPFLDRKLGIMQPTLAPQKLTGCNPTEEKHKAHPYMPTKAWQAFFDALIEAGDPGPESGLSNWRNNSFTAMGLVVQLPCMIEQRSGCCWFAEPGADIWQMQYSNMTCWCRFDVAG